MDIKRVKEMDELQQQVIKLMWADVKDTPDDGQWRKYEKLIIWQNMKLTVKCRFRLSNQFLSLQNMLIHRETSLIEIPQAASLH
jgi:cysteine synthase